MKTRSIVLAAIAALTLVSCGPKEEVHKIAVVAHRGYWNCEEAGFARNSVAALKCACEAGFWGSEFDVNMTADEQLLVHHDGKIDGKVFENYPASEFADFRLENGEPIPTLEDYLAVAENYPKTKLVFEMKKHSCPEIETRAAELSIEALKAHGLLSPDRVMFISFSKHLCEEFVRLCPGFTVQYLESDLTPAEVLEAGINGLDIYYKDVLAPESEYYPFSRENNMSLNVWTVDDVDDMRALYELGVDQLTTNNPVEARALLEEMGIPEELN